MSKPNLIVLASSEPWCSVISRNFAEIQQSWVLNVPALIEESFKFRASAAIVEIPPGADADFCVDLFELANNSFQLKTFAVGDSDMLKWRPLFRSAGVAMYYSSLLQVPSLVESVTRHFNSANLDSWESESSIWSDLPWPTAASDRHA